MAESAPMVSICCLTYNHDRFIRQALNGFLMQKTDFDVEILIHDDASTDNSVQILERYQARYSNVKVIFQKENQFRKTGKYPSMNLYSIAKGKYIAECDGDDYWTDPNKLQKQVDFMEKNPDFSICYHDYVVNTMGHVIEFEHKKDYTQDELISMSANGKRGGIGVLTKMFKNVYSPDTEKEMLLTVGDYPMVVYMGLYGKGKYIHDIGPSVHRRLHGGNTWCKLSHNEQIEQVIIADRQLYDLMVMRGNPTWIEMRRKVSVR